MTRDDPVRNESRTGYPAPPAPSTRSRQDLIDYLRRLPPLRSSDQAAGRPLYLLGEAVTVVPYQRTRDGWACVVVTPSPTRAVGSTLTATDLDIRTALAVDVADPLADLPTATFAAVWQAQVATLGAGPEMAALARALAEHHRHRRSRTVTLDPPDGHHLAQHTAVPAATVVRHLHTLIQAGLLHGAVQPGPDPVGTFTLVLPHTPHRPARRLRPPQPPAAGIYDTRM